MRKAFMRLSTVILVGVTIGAGVGQVSAQIVSSDRYRYGVPSCGWARYYGPTDVIAARIQSQAQLVRAIGDSAVAHAEARKIRADAYRAEIANTVEYARAYWERKSIYEAERMKRYTDPLTRARIHQSQTWERLKNHPELNGPAVVNGTALNFLLDRLSGSVLASHYSLSQHDSDFLAKLNLQPEILSSLRLTEDVPGGNAIVFQANSGESLDISRWPFALQREEFEKQRQQFEDAREVAAEQARSSNEVSNASLQKLMQAHDALDRAFYKYYTREKRTGSGSRGFFQFLTGKRFLQSLAGEIARFQETNGAKGFDEGRRFEGDDLIALLSHMSRNGLKFAPARKGDEFAYHSTFQLMRDLYLTVSDGDLPTVDELKNE